MDRYPVRARAGWHCRAGLQVQVVVARPADRAHYKILCPSVNKRIPTHRPRRRFRRSVQCKRLPVSRHVLVYVQVQRSTASRAVQRNGAASREVTRACLGAQNRLPTWSERVRNKYFRRPTTHQHLGDTDDTLDPDLFGSVNQLESQLTTTM